MLTASYEVLGVVIVAVLVSLWAIKWLIGRKRTGGGAISSDRKTGLSDHHHDIEHRALVFLMSQKTDAMLSALADTIEKEREKLGGIVRNPSMAATIDAFQTDIPAVADNPQSTQDQILPLVNSGMPVTAIARQLHLPENEVSLVMRLNAA